MPSTNAFLCQFSIALYPTDSFIHHDSLLALLLKHAFHLSLNNWESCTCLSPWIDFYVHHSNFSRIKQVNCSKVSMNGRKRIILKDYMLKIMLRFKIFSFLHSPWPTSLQSQKWFFSLYSNINIKFCQFSISYSLSFYSACILWGLQEHHENFI